MKSKIRTLAKAKFDQVIAWRRHLHQNPELSFKEFKTADYIESQLQNIGINTVKRLSQTGLVATITGIKPGAESVIALRADIDALPIQEENDVPYKSQVDGVMHACGHDVHSASLLGVACMLMELRTEFSGTIKLIFQLGEEKLPGGASLMIKEGVLDNPKPKLIIGQHVHPPMKTGNIGFCAGRYMASADEIQMTIHGKGGHAALPHQNIDPILISAQILLGVQQIVSRRANPAIPTVLSFGKINSAGGATNVIPESVAIEGTFRTFNEEWRADAHQLIKDFVINSAIAAGGRADIEIKKGYPVLENNTALTHILFEETKSLLGTDHVIEMPIRMSSEDFSFYSQEIPACFYRLGTGNDAKQTSYSVHTPKFNVDEDALYTSIVTMTYLAIKALNIEI